MHKYIHTHIHTHAHIHTTTDCKHCQKRRGLHANTLGAYTLTLTMHTRTHTDTHIHTHTHTYIYTHTHNYMLQASNALSKTSELRYDT
jgi:hypothetical protein